MTSNTRHGVHSPFVYNLIDQCIYRDSNSTRPVFEYYEGLKANKLQLEGVDYGRNGNVVKRSVSDMIKSSGSQDFEAALLNRLVSFHQSRSVLELGTNLGKSAASMAIHNKESRIHGVEGNEALVGFSNKCFQELGLTNVYCECRTFQDYFDKNDLPYDFIFIDGDHNYASTLENYQASKKCLTGVGPIVLHDIYWSSGMQKAWKEITQDAEATVTIDLFFFGLVYFRPQQTKQHFNVRFPKSLFRSLF